MEPLHIFSTNSTISLAKAVIETININRADDELLKEFPLTKLGDCKIEYFANGEITCQYLQSIRDKKIYIFGDTGTREIMELALMIDAAKRANAAQICAVVPSYGYARQDKKEGIRGPMGAKLVADILSAAGIHRLITIDLHADAIQGFFNVPVNHINGLSIFKDTIADLISFDRLKYIIYSPDAGGYVRAAKFAKKFDLEVGAINKIRDKPGSISKMSMVGDVIGKRVILIDDMLDSGKTLCKAATYLVEEKGAESVCAVCTHPIFSGDAIELILKTDALQQLFVSDTLPISKRLYEYYSAHGCFSNFPKIKIVSSADILGKIIGRVTVGRSMDEVNA